MIVLGNPRTVDELGRVVFPIEVRTILGLGEGDKVVFLASKDGQIYLGKTSCKRGKTSYKEDN